LKFNLIILNSFIRYHVNIYINTFAEGSDVITGRGQPLGYNRTFIPDLHLRIQNVLSSTIGHDTFTVSKTMNLLVCYFLCHGNTYKIFSRKSYGPIQFREYLLLFISKSFVFSFI